jgi:hypothetical protein
MKRGLALVSAIGAGSIWTVVGCGGAAQTAIDGDSGSDSGVDTTSGGMDGGMDGAMPINPGSVGAIVGGMTQDAGGGGFFADGGGSTAMPSTPQVADGCNQLCTKEANAACSAGGTLESCVVGCRLILANPNCASAAQTLFSCLMTANASCDSSGNVVFDRCVVEQLSVDTCFLQNANDPGLATPCATYCAEVAAAKCPNDTSGCQAGCQVIGNLVAGCGNPWKDYVACANGSTLTCGADGKASARACTSQALRFYACVAGGLATILSDAGQ